MNTYKTTERKVLSQMQKSCKALGESNCTFEDIFNIAFNREGIFAETSTPGIEKIISYTFSDVKALVETVANGICKITGVKDKYIGLYCENCVEWVVLFWAILKSGNKPYLVNPNHPDSVVKGDFEALGIKNVLTFKAEPRYDADFIEYYDLLKSGEGNCVSSAFGNEIALSTSGTSMKAKICIYSGKEISRQILNSNQLVERNKTFVSLYEGRIKILSVLPFYHIFGLESTHLWFAMFGATLVFPQKLVPGVLLETIKNHKVTHIFAVPIFWHSIEKSIIKETSKLDEKTYKKFKKACETTIKLQNFSVKGGLLYARKVLKPVRNKIFGDSVKFCISGGSFIKESAMECINGLGYQLFNGYGMTEIGISSVDFSPKAKNRLKPSIGVPFSSAEYSVNKDGELLVKGESLCKKLIIDGKAMGLVDWFGTGDLAEQRNGKYYLKGRSSDLVLSENGENYNPHILEQSLSLPSVSDFCIMGDENNEHLVLVLQLSKGFCEDVKNRIDKEISSVSSDGACIFKKIYYTFEPLISGKDIKISRVKLKNKMLNGELGDYNALSGENMPVNENDSQVKAVIKGFFAELLCVDEADIQDNAHFMNDLGGTSLDYMTLVFRVENHFGISLQAEGEGFNYTLKDFVIRVEDLLGL